MVSSQDIYHPLKLAATFLCHKNTKGVTAPPGTGTVRAMNSTVDVGKAIEEAFNRGVKAGREQCSPREDPDALCAGGEMTVRRFFQFLRSNLRQASRKWAPIARLAVQKARRPYEGPNKRQKWEVRCAK